MYFKYKKTTANPVYFSTFSTLHLIPSLILASFLKFNFQDLNHVGGIFG